jgi:hypothetical protein
MGQAPYYQVEARRARCQHARHMMGASEPDPSLTGREDYVTRILG